MNNGIIRLSGEVKNADDLYKAFKPRPGRLSRISTTATVTWSDKCNYVKRQIDIRSSICMGCGSGKIYDKNNVMYVFTRFQAMEQIKELVEKVRKINQAK